MAEGKPDNKNSGEPAAQPGTVITPGSVAPDKPTGTITFDQDGPAQPGSVVAPAGAEADQPAPQPDPVQPQPVTQASQPPSDQPAQAEPVPEGTIAWTASEFVAHDKSAGWYAALMLCAALVGALVYFISHDFISVGVVVVAALMLAVYGSHKPRQLDYRLDGHGIAIGQKAYAYDQFRSFAIVPEGAFNSIVFMPLRRFSPPISIYYDPKDEERILALLSDRLPFEEHRDAIDSLMRRIRF